MNLQLREDCRRGKRQREMLWAASDVFAALGHDLASMQLIAESAGVTKATLYAHFGDKAQLFRVVIEYWMEELPEPALACEVTGKLRDCLEAVARELLQQSMHPAFLALTNILLRSNWVPQKRWRQRYRPYQAYLEKALGQSARCNDPVRAASQFLLLAVGSIDCSNLIPVNESRISAAVELFVQAYT
ncbi:TetR/AcrR family transcriptional regulator [Pseudomonas sp. EA_105y_Pfl2_R69]|jgi:AcrR family transcriptional regulator|uniref:TetR/AcrR family transcriptional regulator n=1 Tax=Pseudomonas sp. EA_105y_Pfl2_R69 TaxID=3088683 RepID=UPI0030D81594